MNALTHKRRRMLRSRWDIDSYQKRPELAAGFSLRWTEGCFLSVLLKKELVVYNVQGKPCAANGLLSTQVHLFRPSDVKQKETAKDTKGKKRNGAASTKQPFLSLSTTGKYTFRRDHLQCLVQHEWSPSQLITENPTQLTLASKAVIALLYASGKTSVCYVVDNLGHYGIEESSVLDDLKLDSVSDSIKATRLVDIQPTCIEWRPRLCKENGYLTVAGPGNNADIGPCVCFVEVTNAGETKAVGGAMLNVQPGVRTTAMKWAAAAEDRMDDLLVTGHEDSALCVWKVEFDAGVVALSVRHRIEPFTGFPVVHLSVLGEADQKHVTAVSGNMAKTWVVDWESSTEHGEVVCPNNITGMAYVPRESVEGGVVILLLDSMGKLSCWDLQGSEEDLQRVPEDLAQRWKDVEPSEIAFDLSKCFFPSYGVVISPNDALLLTVHIQVDINEAMTGKKPNPLCIIVAHPTNVSWEHMMSSGRSLNDVAWRLEYDMSTNDSAGKFAHEQKCADMIKNISSEDEQTQKMLCALGGLGVTWPTHVDAQLHAFCLSTQLSLHMKHVMTLLKRLMTYKDRNEEETLCLLLCCDLVCLWAKTEECADALDEVWNRRDRISTIKSAYNKVDKSSVKSIDSPEALPCREWSMYAEEKDPPDGKMRVRSPENRLGLIGTVSVSSSEATFMRCQLSLLSIKGGDECLRCPTCETIRLLHTSVRCLAKQHQEQLCILCGCNLVLTSHVSLILNTKPACRDAHVIDRP